VARLEDAAARAGADLRALDANPIDTAWHDRPALPAARVVAHPLARAGQSSEDKRESVGAGLA
jgi:Xaa-Pro aminopeptidase